MPNSAISQPFGVTTVPRQSKPVPILVSRNGLDANSNEINVAFSKFSIAKYIINPTPKLTKSIAIPSNLIVTAFDGDEVYATMSGNGTSKVTYTLNLNEETKFNLKHKIINVMTINEITVVILEDGTIQKYKSNLLTSSHSIPMKDINQIEFIDNKFALIFSELSSALYEIENWTELRVSTNLYETGCQIIQFENKIYKFINNIFHIYDLITLNEIHSIRIPFVKDNSSYISFTVVAENQVCLAVDNEIYYLDLYLGSVISYQKFKRFQWFQILNGALDGSFIIGLSYNHNLISLDIINLEKGNGSLKESLGRGFQNFITNTKNDNEPPLTLKSLSLNDDKTDNVKSHEYDYKSILISLTENVKNTDKFDDIFFTEFNITQEYYTENDRFIINQNFLSQVIELILNNYKFDNDNELYPKTLTYLLTHPLFPIKNTTNLLSKFKDSPRLYKQVIVTCPNLPLNELLYELFSIKNNELSLDISLRILQDYTKDLIKQELKKLPKIDIHNFIKFIVSNNEYEENTNLTPQLFQLLSLVIDSIGLFALDGNLLNNLSEYINKMVEITEQNTEVWHLLDSKMELTSKNKTSNSVISKQKNAKKVLPAYTVEYLDI
ncbi:U3 small nucleolar RNA-associated protein 8 [Monosporozyma unispora]|nr:hypothetical protein C6P44_004237 [Kazachstania unispora]